MLGRLLEINIPFKKKVLDYIAAATSSEFYRCATRTGRHSPGIFVLTEEIITAQDVKEKVWFQSASRTADYARSGTRKVGKVVSQPKPKATITWFSGSASV